jgi:hypothetical protein
MSTPWAPQKISPLSRGPWSPWRQGRPLRVSPPETAVTDVPSFPWWIMPLSKGLITIRYMLRPSIAKLTNLVNSIYRRGIYHDIPRPQSMGLFMVYWVYHCLPSFVVR